MSRALLRQTNAGTWLAFAEERGEVIHDPGSVLPFPPMAFWRTPENARADLERWGFTVILPHEPHFIEL